MLLNPVRRFGFGVLWVRGGRLIVERGRSILLVLPVRMGRVPPKGRTH